MLFCDIPGSTDAFNKEKFMELLSESEASNFCQRQAHSWFLEYTELQEDKDSPGDERLRALLQFCSEWRIIPFGSLGKKIKVTYLPDDDRYYFLTASACLALLRIPTVHSSKNKFFQAMNIALKYESTGFANPTEI